MDNEGGVGGRLTVLVARGVKDGSSRAGSSSERGSEQGIEGGDFSGERVRWRGAEEGQGESGAAVT